MICFTPASHAASTTATGVDTDAAPSDNPSNGRYVPATGEDATATVCLGIISLLISAAMIITVVRKEQQEVEE